MLGIIIFAAITVATKCQNTLCTDNSDDIELSDDFGVFSKSV